MIELFVSGITVILFIIYLFKIDKIANWIEVSLFIERIDKENGYEFETEISQIFTEAGIRHFVTKKTRDGGVDIITENYVVQIKRYSAKKIPLKVITELAVVANKVGKRGVLITNYKLAMEAEKKASKCDIGIIDRKRLIEIYLDPNKLKEYIKE